jgi:cytochrome c oxidase subunit 2
MHSIFYPATPEAGATVALWWWMAGVGGAVWVAVVAAMLYAALSRRGRPNAPSGLGADSDEPDMATPVTAGMHRVLAAALFVTVLILAAFLAYDFSASRALAMRAPGPLTIDVTGHQWWWEVRYEAADSSHAAIAITANEIHVPVGRPVRVVLRAADVIHSFWAPNLGGKRDLIPGYVTSFAFRADTAGTYRGQCAEFCGMQHAKMAFFVVAEAQDEFSAWLARQGTSDAAPPRGSAGDSGARVFLGAGCADCHTIRGTAARGVAGPDLTHVGGRRTIAAGALPNTLGNLEGWIANPQAIKPGAKMPTLGTLDGTQLRAVAAYLETLQ